MKALKKVLIVDDDPVVATSFDRVLSGKGYAVITAASGAEALEKLAAERYDLVFTDIRMPGMSGIEVAERVKASQPWLPVVIVTGFGSEENEARAAAAGVSAFLHKPLSPEMIEGTASEALRSGAARAAAPAPALAPALAPVAAPAPVAEPAAAPARRSVGGFLRNVALFLASPFIGLAYIVALPFVGLAMIVKIAAKAIAAKYPAVAGAAKMVAGPFIGLAFILALPFVGLVMIARVVIRAALGKQALR